MDPTFGSGCVKITPAHDFNDYELGQRHNLPMINIMTLDAALNDSVPLPYRGLDRFVAREKILADLDALGLIERIEPHKLTVPRGDRSNAILEPLLTDQWFVDIKPLAAPAIRAVEDGRVRFVPETWTGVYYDWMHKIRDWCISRQLWWGHRIPAWYDAEGRCYVARSEAEQGACTASRADVPLRQDDDVLDTWFSSALWPFSTLGWPEKTSALQTYYPTSVLVTGFDIIFFWVARMMMLGLKFMGDVPFRRVYIHGLIRDQDGQKMSKSKGNVIDPLDIVDGISLDALLGKRTTGLMQPQMKAAIEKATRKQFPQGIAAYGTDALRLCFARLATQSRDLRFDMAKVEEYRNFCNKLWNAARYVLMNAENQDLAATGAEFSLADRWISSRLKDMLARIEAGFEDYRLDAVANALYEFTWHEFCDWYVELSKAVLQSESASQGAKRGTRITLVRTLEVLLRAMHPLAPFISEEIWQRVRVIAGVSGETIMRAEFPRAESMLIDVPSRAGDALGHGFHPRRASNPRRNGYPVDAQARGSAAECRRPRFGLSRPQSALLGALGRSRAAARATSGRSGADFGRGIARQSRDIGADEGPDRSGRGTRASGKTAAKSRSGVEQTGGETRQQPVCQECAARYRRQGPAAA